MPQITPNDQVAALRRARAGDTDAFGTILRAHQAAALRLATIITGDSTEAYDVVQEAFIKAYQRLATVRDDEAIRGWLLRIVANQAKNSQRSRSRREKRHERHAALRPDHLATTDERALSDLDAEALLTSIGGLSSRDREILALRYFGGLNEVETASALDIAAGTVKSRTSRALTRLRHRLGDSMEDSA